ncbi:MAG: PKD domain-containing protein [Methanoregula sp.]|nr:PKD domain-containing protein [Methanoregula sp.]
MNKKFRITPTFIFCLFFVALFGIATVSAVPPLPQEFYGTVTVNGGVPAPVHSEVRAQVNGADRGSIITDVAGSYGGTGNFVLRLVVQATEADMSGPAVVTFYVNGAKADQQVSYVAGTSTSLALTLSSGGTQTPTPAPTQQPTAQPSTQVPTAAPTNTQPTIDPSAPPVIPEQFYGMVTVANSEPAPYGTMIRAHGTGVLTGTLENPIQVTVPGQYGGTNFSDQRLTVMGSIPDGTPITFTIDDSPALCYNVDAPNGWQKTIPFQSSASTHVDLKSSFLPTAAFSASVTGGSAPLTVDFVDESIGDPTSWNWSFGDGKGSTDQDPRTIYYANGLYTVTLKVRNNDGSDTLTKTDYIYIYSSGGGGGGGEGGFEPVTTTKAPTPTVTIPPVTATSITIGSGDGIALITASPGTTMNSASGGALANLTITRVERSAVPPVPAGATYSFTGIAYDVEPSGATFDPYVTISFMLPENDWNSLANQDLSIKWYNTATSQWEDLQTTVNPPIRTVSAKITHTTVFGLFTNNPPTPVPTTIPPTPATPTPTPTKAAGLIPFLPFNTITLLVIVVVVIIIVMVVVIVLILRRRKQSTDDNGEGEEEEAESSDDAPDWLDLK